MNISSLLAQLSEWLGVIAVAMLAGTSPRFIYRPLVFRFPRREITITFSLFTLVWVVAFIYYSVNGQSQPGLPERFIFAALSLVPFLLALRFREQPIRSLGWGRQMLRPSLLMGVTLCMLALFLRGKIFTLLKGVSTPEAMVLLFWLGISLAEESIFRGYIRLRLVSAWGQWPGIGVTSLLFTLWQIPLLLVMHLTTGTLAVSLAFAFLQGLLLGFIAQKSNNILAPALYRAFSEWLILLP